MEIPKAVSGRRVTNRGVHGPPTGYHGFWLERWQYWIELLVDMEMSWLVVLADGDSVTRAMPEIGGRSVVQLLLEHGVIPIVRYQVKLNYPFPNLEDVEVLVAQCAAFGAPALVCMGNEPADKREWKNEQRPRDWFERYCAWFSRHAPEVARAGAYPGFADAPVYGRDPWPLMSETWGLWEDEIAWWAGHYYGLNRPPDYPYDSVQQAGQPLLSEQDLVEWFGPHYEEPGMNELSVAAINTSREAGAWPGLTASQDATCFRGYERVLGWMKQHFGRVLAMGMTEGGWTPGAFCDPRYPKATPVQVAEWTRWMCEESEAPMFAFCSWLLASGDMGASGWPFDVWVGWCWDWIYGREKSVVGMLRETPAGGEGEGTSPLRALGAARGLMAEAAGILDIRD